MRGMWRSEAQKEWGMDGLKDKYTGLPQYGSPKNFAVA